MNEDECREPLRRYLDRSTGRLRFRSGGMTVSRWVGALLFGATALCFLVAAIVSPEERWRSILTFLIFGALIALMLAFTFGYWTELEHADGEWVIQPGFWRWKARPIRVRDADVMTVFVRTRSSWPDFDEITSLKIEFPALPFAGAPRPLEILKGYGIPEIELAHLGKMFEEFAQAVKSK